MALQVMRQYRFERGEGGLGIVADWICNICGKIAYEETNIFDVPKDELKAGCKKCIKAMALADEIADKWWAQFNSVPYFSRAWGSTGLYGLRDDLVRHLARGETADALVRYARRNGLELPTI